jgi:hypothetical protein
LEPVVASRANKAEVFDIIADWNMRTAWAIAAVLAPFLTTASVMFAQAVYSTARDSGNIETGKLNERIAQLSEWNGQWQQKAKELQSQCDASKNIEAENTAHLSEIARLQHDLVQLKAND